MDRPSDRLTRRQVLMTAVGAGAAAGLAGESAAQDGQRHTVDMTDQLVFDPEVLTVAPGDTVVWENVGSVGHSVTAYEADIPADAEYFASGGFDSEQSARNAYTVGDAASGDIAADESFEHTFDVVGDYEYFCIPHESVGMVGRIEVTTGGAPGDDGGPVIPTVPDASRLVAIAAAAGVFFIITLTYFFLKYGGDYGLTDEDGSDR